MELKVIIKDDNTVIIASERKAVMAVYNCKTAKQIANAVEKYIEEELNTQNSYFKTED